MIAVAVEIVAMEETAEEIKVDTCISKNYRLQRSEGGGFLCQVQFQAEYAEPRPNRVY
jgi:hypothetical protein